MGLVAIHFHREKNTREELRDRGTKYRTAQTKIESFVYPSGKQDKPSAAGKNSGERLRLHTHLSGGPIRDTCLQALYNKTPLTFLLISVNWENIKDQ